MVERDPSLGDDFDRDATGEVPRVSQESNVRTNHNKAKKPHKGRERLIRTGMWLGGLAAVGTVVYYFGVRPQLELRHQKELRGQEVAFDASLRQAGYNTSLVEFTDYSRSSGSETAKVVISSSDQKGCEVAFNVVKTGSTITASLPDVPDANGNLFPSFVSTDSSEVETQTNYLCDLKAKAEAELQKNAPSASPSH